MRIHASAAMLAFCLLTAGSMQGAAAQTYAYTSLNTPACKDAPGNAQARKNDHGVVTYHCPGAAGWRVRLVYQGVATRADFIPPGQQTPVLTLSAPYDIGPRIEWISAAKGASPHAAIVRLHVRTDQNKTASALALLRINGDRMCLATLAGPDDNAGLRALAQPAPCPPQTTIFGTGATVIQELLERNR